MKKNMELNCGSRDIVQSSYQERGHYLKHVSGRDTPKASPASTHWLDAVSVQLEIPRSREKVGLATHPNPLFPEKRNVGKPKRGFIQYGHVSKRNKRRSLVSSRVSLGYAMCLGINLGRTGTRGPHT